MKATPDIFYRKIKSDKKSTPPIFVSVTIDIWVIDQRVRSRWLDIVQVLFLHVFGPRQSRGP